MREVELQEIMTNMAIFVAFYTSEGDALIIQGLDPLFILKVEENLLWEGFGSIHVNID